MAASCISLSSAAVGSASTLAAPAVTARQPVALCIAGVSRPLSFPLGESLHLAAVVSRRKPLDFSARSYGGYGAEPSLDDKEDWSPPPPPGLNNLSSEPMGGTNFGEPMGTGMGTSNFTEPMGTNNFTVPQPDERDFGGFRREPEPNTKLYVGNIAWNVDSKMLADCFQSVGVTELEEVNVMYDRMLGKSRGFAFVTLSSEDAARSAIEKLDGYELEGRPLRVNYPQVPRGGAFGGGGMAMGGGMGGMGRPPIPANPAKLFVANIPWSIDDQGLQEFFSSQGTVVDCRILTDAETGRSRGIGFITFSSPDEASNAISALDGAELGGRSIRVALATGRP